MTTYDITGRRYKSPGGYKGLDTTRGWQYRKFTGAELKTLKDGQVTVDGDVFKIAPIEIGTVISKVRTIVVDADDTALTLDIGYTDGTNGSATTFETDAALNSTGVTDSSDDIIYFTKGSGYTLSPFLTITPSSISDLDDATEFIVGWFSEKISETIAATLSTPV